MKSDFEVIKKKYGENFAKLCRNIFPTILESEGVLPKILEENFEPNHFLYEDLIRENCVKKFKNYINSFYKMEDIENINVSGTPEELFDKAGYKLYKCETNKDVLSFKKYYKEGEELCTFRDPYRIEDYTIFWAVKKNVDEIKRENFTNPKRQDEYGTSVISLQFSKGKYNTLSIKNRYNHRVSNPDATFSNDLENIYAGLTNSFRKYYNINLYYSGNSFELPGYVMANDGKFYKWNYEINNIYYCPNNIVINNGNVIRYDKSKYEIVDYFEIDKQLNTVKCLGRTYDSFTQQLSGAKKIEIKKLENGERLLTFTFDNEEHVEIVVDKYNRIIKFTNNHVTEIGKDFLVHNQYLLEFNANNVKKIGENFLRENTLLKEFNVKNLKHIGKLVLYNNKSLEVLDLPNVEIIEDRFMSINNSLTEFNAKNLQALGVGSLVENTKLEKLDFPNLKQVESGCFKSNNSLKYINLPKLQSMGGRVLNNIDLNKIEYLNTGNFELLPYFDNFYNLEMVKFKNKEKEYERTF